MSICIFNTCTLQNKLGWSAVRGVIVDVDSFTQYILYMHPINICS